MVDLWRTFLYSTYEPQLFRFTFNTMLYALVLFAFSFSNFQMSLVFYKYVPGETIFFI